MRVLILVSLALLWMSATTAFAEKRLALVIGNDDYQSLPNLKKAVNDARAVATTLEEIGFQVISGENLTRRRMNRSLAKLLGSITPGDQVFFFFAGHGLALGAENYLIPSDMPKPGTGEQSLVRDEGYAVSNLVARVRARGAASTFFVLDACRDNPFASVGVRSIGAARGFTRMEAPSGVFLLFSAGIGQRALDGLHGADTHPNSVFTRKLVPLLRMQGLTHVRLAKRVQSEVDALARTVGHEQQPAYYDQIIGEIVLRKGNGPGAITSKLGGKHSNNAISILIPTTNYTDGALLRFSVRTKIACHVTVVHATHSAVTILIPNKYKPTAFIPAGNEIRIPPPNAAYRFRVADSGIEELVAICTSHPNPLGLDNHFDVNTFTTVNRNHFDALLQSVLRRQLPDIATARIELHIK